MMRDEPDQVVDVRCLRGCGEACLQSDQKAGTVRIRTDRSDQSVTGRTQVAQYRPGGRRSQVGSGPERADSLGPWLATQQSKKTLGLCERSYPREEWPLHLQVCTAGVQQQDARVARSHSSVG